MVYYALSSRERNEPKVGERIEARRKETKMGCRLHIQSVHKKVNADGNNEVGYQLTVRYNPSEFFSSGHTIEIEEWLETWFNYGDYAFWIPKDDFGNAPMEIGKQAFKTVLEDKELFDGAVKDAMDAGFAYGEDEVRKFIEAAIASECDDDIVRLEWF